MSEKEYTSEIYEKVDTFPPIGKASKTSTALRRSIKDSLEEEYGDAMFEDYEAENMLESIGFYGIVDQDGDEEDFVAVEVNPDNCEVYFMAQGPSEQIKQVEDVLSTTLQEWREREYSSSDFGSMGMGL